ncbi:MAG: hypothetical protein QF391_10495, partial [Myxococcota bacterium]|nr:hypothetical protein [Myxococcota bacterium]
TAAGRLELAVSGGEPGARITVAATDAPPPPVPVPLARDAIVAATLIRGVGEFARAARDLIASIADPGEAVVEAILFALRELPRDPLLGSLILAGEVKLTDAEFPDAMRVLEYVLAPLSEAAHWKPDDLEECGELVMRLGLSLMASPRVDRSEKELRAFLHRRVVPALRLDRQQ